MTPEMAKRADDHAKQLTEEKRRKKEQYIEQRDEKLKSLGLEGCADYYKEKLAEVREIAGIVEKEAVKEAQKVLELAQGTSEADASGSIPESAAPKAVTSVAPLSVEVNQIPDSTIIISPSSSTDSDQDHIPLSQKFNLKSKTTQKPEPYKPVYPAVLKSIGELSQMRIDICNRLPADHPSQHPMIEPLQVIPADTTTSTQSPKTRQTPLQEGQASAAAEGFDDPEEPNTSDLPHCDSPSNLFSLERHLGGELMAIPQKASKSIPNKVDLVNNHHPNQLNKSILSKQNSKPQHKFKLQKRPFRNLLLKQLLRNLSQ